MSAGRACPSRAVHSTDPLYHLSGTRVLPGAMARPAQLPSPTAGVLLHLRRLSVGLDAAENTGWHQASPRSSPFCTHTRGPFSGARFLFGESSLLVTPGLTLEGCSRRGSPRLRWTLRPDDWRWLARPGRPEPFALSSSRTPTGQENSFPFSTRLLASTVALCVQTSSVTQLCHGPTPLMAHFESPQR